MPSTAPQSAPSGLQVLLTGFEPFGGDPTNPSWPAARDAARQLQGQGIRAEAVQLPCAFEAAAHALREALRRHRPEVVIAVGLAGGTSAVRVERVAVNLQDARIPDNHGHQPTSGPCVPGGPTAWFSTLPVKRTAAALQAAQIPAQLSLSAGTFVCNHVFAHLMDATSGSDAPEVPTVRAAGFVHVPWSAQDQAVTSAAGQALPAEQLSAALVIVAREALDPASDDDRPAGTLH